MLSLQLLGSSIGSKKNRRLSKKAILLDIYDSLSKIYCNTTGIDIKPSSIIDPIGLAWLGRKSTFRFTS